MISHGFLMLSVKSNNIYCVSTRWLTLYSALSIYKAKKEMVATLEEFISK